MPYKHDMSEEKKPKIKVLLPEGLRKFRIIDCQESKSKQSNMMFVLTCLDVESGNEDTWYAVAEPKKRWFLKRILAACGISAAQDGVYDWDIPDILDKEVNGLVVHEDNDWINREGETVKSKQHKITDITEVEWDSDK